VWSAISFNCRTGPLSIWVWDRLDDCSIIQTATK
jgi:hypothetical protein